MSKRSSDIVLGEFEGKSKNLHNDVAIEMILDILAQKDPSFAKGSLRRSQLALNLEGVFSAMRGKNIPLLSNVGEVLEPVGVVIAMQILTRMTAQNINDQPLTTNNADNFYTACIVALTLGQKLYGNVLLGVSETGAVLPMDATSAWWANESKLDVQDIQNIERYFLTEFDPIFDRELYQTIQSSFNSHVVEKEKDILKARSQMYRESPTSTKAPFLQRKSGDIGVPTPEASPTAPGKGNIDIAIRMMMDALETSTYLNAFAKGEGFESGAPRRLDLVKNLKELIKNMEDDGHTVTPEEILVGTQILARIAALDPQYTFRKSYNPLNLCVVAMIMGQKCLSEKAANNNVWSYEAGFPPQLVNNIERDLLALLNFKPYEPDLMRGYKQFYDSMVSVAGLNKNKERPPST